MRKCNKKENNSIKRVTLIPELKLMVKDELPKSINAGHYTVVKIQETTMPFHSEINPRDIYTYSVLLDKTKSYFCKKIKDITRYELNVLIVIHSLSASHIGSKRQTPVPRPLCKGDIYNLFPFASNVTVNKTLNLMLSKGIVSVLEHKNKSGQSRKGIIINKRGHLILNQFNEFYLEYLEQCFNNMSN